MVRALDALRERRLRAAATSPWAECDGAGYRQAEEGKERDDSQEPLALEDTGPSSPSWASPAASSTVVALGAMAEGMVQNYGRIFGTDNDLLVTQADAYDPSLASLDEDLRQRIAALPGVENVDPGVFTFISAEGLPFLAVFGYEPEVLP